MPELTMMTYCLPLRATQVIGLVWPSLSRARDHRQSRVLRESGIGLAWRVNKESPLVHADGAIEHDVDGRALAQLDFAPTRQEDRREPNRSARASADTRCFPTAVREAAYGNSQIRRLDDQVKTLGHIPDSRNA
jgi:hypothetical protein